MDKAMDEMDAADAGQRPSPSIRVQ